jgi:hypothetical protein
MGFFGKILDQGRNGADRDIQCQTCGSTYSGNIDRGFPYAICGWCLEKVGVYAKEIRYNALYQQIQLEVRRRGS